MCLLVVLSRTVPGLPLVVAANRDELLERPAVSMTVLSASSPRIIGGRDGVAGGTWLAVNEAGVVAGLTNRPVEGGRDASKRSRGELPLLAARHASARAATAALVREVAPSQYNPAWMLVGDRDALFAVDLSDHAGARVEELSPGVHILENSPPGTDSPKVRRVRSLLQDIETVPAADVETRLAAVLADHEVPAVSEVPTGPRADIAVAARAACVHTESYGTRWSCLVAVASERKGVPSVRYADGPPCTTSFVSASAAWEAAP